MSTGFTDPLLSFNPRRTSVLFFSTLTCLPLPVDPHIVSHFYANIQVTERQTVEWQGLAAGLCVRAAGAGRFLRDRGLPPGDGQASKTISLQA